MPLLFPLLSVGLAVLLGLVALTYLRAYARLARTETTAVADVRPGMGSVSLAGTARPLGDPLPARFQDADTLLNEWTMQKRVTGGEGTNSWGTLERGYDAEPFVLDDGTGKIVVDPVGAEWVLDRTGSLTVAPGESPPRAVREFLAEVDRYPNDAPSETGPAGVGGNRRRYTAHRLDPGDDVYVHGPVSSAGDPNAPEGATDPFVGTTADLAPGANERVSMPLTRDLLPFVGDSGGTLSLGGADETALFTVAGGSAGAATSDHLKRGLVLAAVAACFGGFGVWLFLAG